MSELDRDALIKRVRKVLALRQSPNENEAANAWERVQVMLTEHNLTMEDVQFTPNDDMDMEHFRTTTDEPWRRNVGAMVGQMYFCIYFYHDTKTPDNKVLNCHYMAGAKHDVKVASIMFDYICGTIADLTERAANLHPVRSRKRYRETFIDACASRVCARIKERIDKARRGEAVDWQGNNLPVLASEYDRKLLEAKSFMDQQYDFSGGAEKETNLPVITDERGMLEGYKAGDKIGLDQQVTKTEHKRLN